ncbi:hypothetical protein [Jeotgalibacillus proteolyticus]|uniref:Uncharacterized protein n=1 Tax=Jeotgalibacillus proteolyticus TaxID=2082395 RepID=A0A2S5GFU8_9BACL|nr:hypothetical protein [Jeotgalibacillus proteolyticus]PPA71897.1 hypothetical protein C4B60_00515 [Jeotgalibacillus proteolyticus]
MLRDSTPNVSFVFGMIKYVQASLDPLKADILISTRQLNNRFTNPMIIIRPRDEKFKELEFGISAIFIDRETLFKIREFLMSNHYHAGSFIDYYNSQMLNYGSYCGERSEYFFN